MRHGGRDGGGRQPEGLPHQALGGLLRDLQQPAAARLLGHAGVLQHRQGHQRGAEEAGYDILY